jgi:Ala-tRNA(Pro) deacylase
MATATWVRSELDQSGIAYDELHHSDAFTAQELAEREHTSGHRVAKVVCVMADSHPVELVLPASRRVDFESVRGLLGVMEVRLASEAELQHLFTECEVGAIPALRHWRGIEVIMDGHLRTGETILIQGGTHCDAVRMRFDDWFELVNPRVEWFTTPMHTGPGRTHAS